jgi:hypothetical protein
MRLWLASVAGVLPAPTNPAIIDQGIMVDGRIHTDLLLVDLVLLRDLHKDLR